MADGYGMKVEDVQAMKLTPTDQLARKPLIFNANNPTNFERPGKASPMFNQAGLVKDKFEFNQIMDFSIVQDLEKAGTFKHHQDNYVSKFVPTTYNKVNAEAPIITQTVRINFYPNSSNIYEPAHDLTGNAIQNTLYDLNVEATLDKVARLVGAYDRAVVAIVGHTGQLHGGKIPEQIVKDLSMNRAEAVKKALVDKYKFDPKKFVVEGEGWNKPADTDNNPMNQALNRRVEVSVYTN